VMTICPGGCGGGSGEAEPDREAVASARAPRLTRQ